MLLLLCLLAAPAVPAAECPPTDEASVVQTLNQLYAAKDAGDADGVRRVIASDFVAQEDGERVDGEALVQRLSATAGADPSPPAGADPPPAIVHPEVHILCDSAWATFRAPPALHAAAEAGRERAESAVLSYQDDGWRVRFLNTSLGTQQDGHNPVSAAAGQRAGRGGKAGRGGRSSHRSHGHRTGKGTGAHHAAPPAAR